LADIVRAYGHEFRRTQVLPGLTNVIEDFIILGLFVSAGFVAL
jgi:hypothetical protein